MLIQNLKTSNGGAITVHFGKSMTSTNLFLDRWLVIDDVALITLMSSTNGADTAAWKTIKSTYEPKIMSLAHVYVRQNVGAPGAPAPASTQSIPVTPASASTASTPSVKTVNTSTSPDPTPSQTKTPDVPADPDVAIKNARKSFIDKLTDFFADFHFKPAARFINSFVNADDPTEYTVGYFALVNHPDLDAITKKTLSSEFKMLKTTAKGLRTDKRINARFECMYGDPGVGKTVTAIAENPSATVMGCLSGMLDCDLLRTFDFNDENGQPVYRPTALRTAMENGEPIILDEINLLSFDCLRLLQEITDNKGSLYFPCVKETITIKDGFKIIGTMNLVVNGSVYSLPDPLVDRAYRIRHLTVTSEQLADWSF